MSTHYLKSCLILMSVLGASGCQPSPPQNIQPNQGNQSPKLVKNEIQSKGSPAQEKNSQPLLSSPSKIKTVGNKVFGSLLVNGYRNVRLGKGMPVWISCVLNNPHPSSVVNISGLSGLVPNIEGSQGKAFVFQWEPVRKFPEEIPPNGSVQLEWLIKTDMKPGKYGVTWKPESDVLVADFDIDAFRIKPVQVEMADQETDPRWSKHFHRQIQFLRGEFDQVIASLQEELARHPELIFLRNELADAYQAKGDLESAENQLRRLAVDYQERPKENGMNREEDFPRWLGQRISEIHRLRLQNQR